MPDARGSAHRLALFPFRESLVVLSLFLGLEALPADAEPADSDLPSPAVQEAERDSANGRFPAAKEKLNAVLASKGASRRDRDEAGVELARIEWRIDGRPDAARERLVGLIPAATKKLQPLLLLSRMERSLLRFEAARAAARGALAAAERKDERDSATTSLARALVEEDVLAARDGKESAFEETARRRVREALGLVLPLVTAEPGLLAASQGLLDAALLLDDGPSALVAWRSYYTAAGAADSTLLAKPRAALGEVLPRWKGPASSREDREALVKALLDSRFFTEAVLVARDPRAREPARVDALPWVKDLVAYEAYLEGVRQTTDLYYRDVARGTADSSAWEKALADRTEALWKALSWPGEAPPLDGKGLDGAAGRELDARFGTVTGAGKTGGIPNLHMGHRVVDEKRTAEQYGRRAAIHFIALDAIVSNGYETWMWDGHGAHGGWGDTGLIVQVRPAYAGGALGEWQELTDPERRAKADARMAEETSRDEESAVGDPFGYLPGLALRLRRQGSQRILDSQKAKGLAGAELRSAFVAAIDRAVLGSSIFAHEGRHAIDAEFETHFFGFLLDGGFRSSEALEYRAKLSEIAFAPEPRLAFGGILTESIGSPTPHGKANLKLMKGLVSWMEAHRAEIARLEAGKPLLPRLDRLTDEQLRAAARSLDPMAGSAP